MSIINLDWLRFQSDLDQPHFKHEVVKWERNHHLAFEGEKAPDHRPWCYEVSNEPKQAYYEMQNQRKFAWKVQPKFQLIKNVALAQNDHN